jgi:anti-sigma factor RsiW
MIRRLLSSVRFKREHRWTHAHLSDYLDGQLGPEERKRVEAHARICPHCSRILATLRRMLEGLHMLEARPETGISDGVIERLRQEG